MKQKKNSNGKNDNSLSISQIEAIFKEAGDNEITAIYTAIHQSIMHLESITQTFIEKSGNEYAVNFDLVSSTLSSLANNIEKYGKVKLAVVETSPQEITEDKIVDSSNSSNSSNQIGQNSNSELSFQSTELRLISRQDVERCFELICDYYKEFEPSSPIPVLINRSKKLVQMSFLDIVKEMMPDALEQINKLGGITEDTNGNDGESTSNQSNNSW